MRSIITVSVFASALIGLADFSPEVLYVDKEKGDDVAAVADETGKTPFKTIQKAVDVAIDGMTILVAPGVYDQGNGDPPANGGWGLSRVGWANKKLFLKSTHGPQVTHITGVHSKDTDLGIGNGAVRCLAFKSDNGAGAGSVVEGFTLRDGATVNDGGVGYKAWGGAFYSNSHDFHVVNCVISNCVAYEAGVFANGTLYRCLVEGNAVRSGQYLVRSSLTARSRLYSSVLTRNHTEKDGILAYNVDMIGCSLIGNKFGSCTYNATGSARNCVFLGTGGLHNNFTYQDCVTSGRAVISPLLGDWRALSSGSAESKGNASHTLEMILPEGYVAQDFYGCNLPKEGSIAAGASAFVTTHAGGCVSTETTSGMKVDGRPVFSAASLNYVFAETYPTQFQFAADAQIGKRVCYYTFEKISELVDMTPTRFPETNDCIWVMPPPAGYELKNKSVVMSSKLLWVKPPDGREEEDGTEEKPFSTIQAAIENAPANAVICCKSGTYSSGEGSDGTGKSRVMFKADTTVRLISENGASETVILGESSTVASAVHGCGEGAVRCVRGNGMQQVQGFTLTGGRTTASEYGGAARSGGTDLFISDCIITNNAAGNAGAAYFARLQRCYIADNIAKEILVVWNAPLSACVIAGNTVASASTRGYIGYSSPAYNCTFIMPDGHSPVDTWVGNCPLYNSIVVHGKEMVEKLPVSGCVFWGVERINPTGDYAIADPYLADESARDAHPFSVSSAFTTPLIPAVSNYGKSYWFWVSTDFDKIPFVKLNEGKPFAGACGVPSEKNAAIVKAPSGGLSVADGVCGIEESGSLRITATKGARPCIGVTVKGKTYRFEDSANKAVSIPHSMAGGGVVVEALYTNVWYVAVGGDDSAAGSYPDAALTLEGALSNPGIMSGDRVLALPGEYSAGDGMVQGEGFEIRARAVVPSGVTLESTGGRAVTVIKGRAATNPDEPTTAGWSVRGMGKDAMRCVYLGSGSRVKGFTLTEGFTRVKKGGSAISPDSPDTTGGGVYAMSGTAAWVEDCLVTNCAAYRGGGVIFANVLRCELVDNYSLYFGSAASDCACYESITRGNVHPGWAVSAGISYWSEIEGCSILDALGEGASDRSVIANTLVRGSFYAARVKVDNIRNCALNIDKLVSHTATALADAPGTVVAASSSLAVDSDGRPVIGSNVAVDAGDVSLSRYIADFDLSGNQRIYNARRDIGALESDWRDRYVDDIGARGFSVVEASPMVEESPEGLVRLNPGSSIVAHWTVPSATGKRLRSVAIRITGGGSASVFYNGEALEMATAGDGVVSVPFRDDLSVNELAFAYSGDGYAEILGIENAAGMKVIIR